MTRGHTLLQGCVEAGRNTPAPEQKNALRPELNI
jgi:hypothetical protein